MQSHSNLVERHSNKNARHRYMRQPFFKPFIQPKLTVNQPNDAFEQEADTMADNIMRMGDDSVNQKKTNTPVPPIQLKCQQCEEEDKLLNRKETAEHATPSPETESYIHSLNGKGRSLTTGEKTFFEPRFGYDFSNVQLHTGTQANESAKDLNALAYTHANNIVFAPGQYQPGTESGKRLMAHELTHVVQQGNATAHPNIQRDENKKAPAAAGKDKQAAPAKEEVNELDYAFVFAGGPYGQAAERFIKQYNPDHTLIKANSFEEMMDRLYSDVQRHATGKRNHIREIIIVTHANAAGGMQIPLARTDAQKHRFFTPWDLADLQKDFRGGLFTKFRQERSSVVSSAIDDDTTVVVRGCEFGQSQEALDALRIFFGGQPHVWAPKAYQGYESVKVGDNSFLHTPEEAFDFLVKQDFLPPELSPAPDEEKKKYIARVFGNKSIPDEFFVVGKEAHDELNKDIKEGKGMSTEAEKLKDREDAGVPGGKMWGSSSPSALGSDAELDGLTKEEIEKRATALMTPYKPQNAAMLQRLRHAWERKTSGDVLKQNNPDPLFGLPPENIFGDPNIIAGDASKYGDTRTPHVDEFEKGTLPSLADKAKQMEASGDYDNEVADKGTDEPDQASQTPGASGGNTPAPANQGTSASGSGKQTVQQIMDNLKMKGGDFSKSHNGPSAQPVVTPDEVPDNKTTAETTDKKEDTSFQLPGITRQFSEAESIGVELLLDANPAFIPLVQSAKLLTSLTDTTVGIGIQGSANAVVGGSPGAGIVIRGGRIIALYGSLAGNAGFTVGLSAEMQVTIIKGGLENFSGASVSATGGGGEVLVGHGSLILNTNKEVIGVSVSGGIGAGITAIEGYMSYQGTHVPAK